MPPYQGEPDEVHAWLHDDANDQRDTDHPIAKLIQEVRP